MSVFGEQIAALESRLKELEAELKPLQTERAAVLRSIKNLKEEQERVENPEAYRERKKREYVSLKERKRSVAAFLAENPDATNLEISRVIKTSPARVSQIRKELGLPPRGRGVQPSDNM